MYAYSCEEYITSQFAVRFDENGNLDESQRLERTKMVVNASREKEASMFNPFHNTINVESEMHEKVAEFIND